MKIVNMTPHQVTICDASNKVVHTYPASGETIRLKAETITVDHLPDGTPLSRTVFGDPVGLPAESTDTIYIVSQLIKSALPERRDLAVPAQVVRDGNGNIIGCQSLGV